MKALLFILAIALGTGFAVRATLDTDRNASAVRRSRSEHDELRNKILHEQQRLQALRQTSAGTTAFMATAGQVTPNDDAAARTTSTLAAAAESKLTAPSPNPSPIAVVANDPKLMPRALRDYRVQIRLGNLQSIGLSNSQIEALKDAMVEKEQRRMDLAAAVETQGLDQKSDTFKTLNAESERLHQKKEAEILGDLESAYREYGRARLVRWGVTAFALAALDTGEPVYATQFEQVTQILAANSERIQPNSDWAIVFTGWKTGDVKADTVNWDVASPQLQGVLTPTQVETLRRHYQSDVASWNLEKQIWDREALLTAQFKKQQPKQ